MVIHFEFIKMESLLIFALSCLLLPCIQCELTKVVDLTWDFSNDTIYWKGVSPFTWTKILGNNERGYWYGANEFCAGEHGGTHFDAPYHFYKDGWKVADVPISRLIAKGATIEVNEGENLSQQHLIDWVKENGEFEDNTVLLVRFGRSQYYSNKTKYFDVDADGNFNFPSLTSEAATWIAQTGKIVGVGIDVPSVDPGLSTDFMAHRILSENQLYILENVKLLEKLPAKDFTLLVLPMKLKEGTGAPLRIFATPKISL